MCDKLTDTATYVNCSSSIKTGPGGATKCGTTFKWMWDCSTASSDGKKKCEAYNRHLSMAHLLDLMALVIPFGATYGEWLGGVTDPDLNTLIKAFTGSMVINLVINVTEKRSKAIDHALLWSLGTGGWVLAVQIIQDYVFHGSPNRLIAAFFAGLANYYRTVGTIPLKHPPKAQEVGGFLIFATLMGGFAGNWSMMGDNLLSRFMSTTFAGFFTFFGTMGQEYQDCLISNKIFPKEAFMGALQLGMGSSLVGIIVDSAFGKPVLSGLAAGASGIYIAKSIFDNNTFKVCGKVK